MKWSGKMSKLLNELSDGEHITIHVLVTQVNKGITAKGSPYLSFILQDKSGTMDAKYWNVREEYLQLYKPGMLVSASGDILSHNKQLQFRISSLEILDRSEVDLREFVQSSNIPRLELKNNIEKFIHTIQNKNIQSILLALLEEYEKDFYAYPAASKNHHNFVGGLATHVLGMLKLANQVCELYPTLNRDLLFGGVLLHDLGKLIELSGPIITEYTMEGKLLGHISIMQAKVASVAEHLNIEGEEVILLRHMILSHHGVYEYGSPVLPMLPEAEILFYIDNMDAKMNAMEKALEQVQPGEFTPRIFSLDNRSFYKSNLKK